MRPSTIQAIIAPIDLPLSLAVTVCNELRVAAETDRPLL
jgi:hypothetical protein